MINRMLIDIQEEHVKVTTHRDGIASTKNTNLAALQEVLTRNTRIQTPLLPSIWGVQQYIKIDDRELFVMSTEAHIREVKFDYRDDGGGVKKFLIPVPHLVWFIMAKTHPGSEERSYHHGYVYALKHQIMSLKDTLYKFPFSNVDSRYICWGGNAKPSWTSSKGIMGMPEYFFAAPFNSDLGSDKYEAFTVERKGVNASMFRTSHLIETLHDDHVKAQAEGKAGTFRYSQLMPQSTLGQAIDHWTRQLQN